MTGRSDREHLENLKRVLERLRQHGMRLKKGKCYFMQQSGEYLGYKIDSVGLHATQDKVEAIASAPQPKDVGQLRSFLGLVNYYGKFLKNLATTAKPLYNLLQWNVKWKWTSDCEAAFCTLKEQLMSTTVLVHYDATLPLTLACDASSYGVGAVIAHVMADGSERPVAYASRTLTQSEKNYSQIEKEALAIIFGIKKFHQFLYGRSFTLVSDNKPLTTIFGPKTNIPTLAAARLQRWAILLSAYQYNIQ